MTFKRLAGVLWLTAVIILPWSSNRADASQGIEPKTVLFVAKVAKFLKQPLAQRKLSDADSAKYVRLAHDEENDLIMRVAAVQALAYANDKASHEALNKLLIDNSMSPMVSSVTWHSLRVRSNASRSSEEFYGILAFHLGKSISPLDRMFIANRLALDYSERGLWAILQAAKVETDERAKCDLFYYLSQSNDPSLLKETLALSWMKEPLEPTEYLAFLFGSITPGRPTDVYGNTPWALSKKIKIKLASLSST
jgi:hypothetical protein